VATNEGIDSLIKISKDSTRIITMMRKLIEESLPLSDEVLLEVRDI
jgi:hypothetical protein